MNLSSVQTGFNEFVSNNSTLQSFWETAGKTVTLVQERGTDLLLKVKDIVFTLLHDIAKVAKQHPKEVFVAAGITAIIGIAIGSIFGTDKAPARKPQENPVAA